MTTYQTSAKILVNKMSNALLDDKIKKPISQLDYEYSDGDYSGLAYLPNVAVLEDEDDLDLAYTVLLKIKPEILEILRQNEVFEIEDILAAQAELEAMALDYEEDGENDEDDEMVAEYEDIAAPVLDLKSIIEESYRSGIDGLFTEDLEPMSIDNQFLYSEETNSFNGVFTDGDKIFSFDLVDETGEDDWELSYLDVTDQYE